MTRFRTIVCFAFLASALTGCNEGSEDQPAKASAKAKHVSPSERSGVAGVSGVNVSADALDVGTALNGEAAVRAQSMQFTTADTIYASASRGRLPPAGGTAHVFWTYQDGRTHKEENKPVVPGQQSVWFSFAAADGMKPGHYNVEIDVNMRPIGIVDFDVR